MNPKFNLITRADDAGSCESANHAILQCVEAGVIKNVSFMACGPAIEHAAQLFRGRDDVALGLHVCLNAEWEDVKWGPLSSAPLLCDDNGFFLPTPNDTYKRMEETANRKWRPDFADARSDLPEIWFEATKEIEQQYQRLRELGLQITYVDEHMGVSWCDASLRAKIVALCDSENLVDHFPIPSLPKVEKTGDPFADLETQFRAANRDRYLWVNHPGLEAPDMKNFNFPGRDKGIVARERAAETALLCDPRLPELLKKWCINPARYDEV